MKKILLLSALFLWACTGNKAAADTQTAKPAKTVLLEKVEKKGGEIVIPYEKYQLANGLTVIVHEDHSDPIAHVDITYHVGSAREEINRSGFAHFFEHMMFQGSDNVADEEHFKLLSEAGGTLNGTTNSDRTNYYETIPSNQLELALWLEADRMGFLLDAVNQKKFDNQRETVKNERGQRVDNVPFGRLNETASKALYPYGHGYNWPVIGWMKDLNAATVADLKSFFLRWYGPNNATLTVGGDVNAADVIKLAEKYFGPIERGPEVKMPEKPAIVLDGDRYVSFEDNVPFPLIQMTFPTVPVRHADEAPLDLLSNILGSGKNSIFYKNLIKTQIALNAVVQHPCRELAGEFQLIALPHPASGKSLADLEKIMRDAIVEFETRGVNEDDLLKAKVQYETQTINSLSSVAGKVSTLAANQTFTGNANYIKEDLRRYNAVTKDDVMRVYNKYIKNKHAVIVSVYQKGQKEQVAAEDNYTLVEDASKIKHEDYSKLTYKKPVDNFDRSKKPKAGPNPVVNVPEYWTEQFDNGLNIIGTINSEIPSVFLQVSIKGGHHAEPLEKSGLAALTAAMMNEATENYSNEELHNELAKTGSTINFSAGTNYSTITIQSLTKYLDRTLELANEKFYSPKFDEADFNRIKAQHIQNLRRSAKNASVVANNVFNRVLYGSDHAMSVSANGTIETVNNITLDDVKMFYKTFYAPNVSNLVVVGALPKAAIMPKLSFLTKWKKRDVVLPEHQATKRVEKTQLYFVNNEGAAQSEIRIGNIALPFDATGDFYKAGLMNFALGGAFNSRINLNLREDKGYTYGAFSYFSGGHHAGPFTAQAGVRANATDSSLVEFLKEIKGYQAGITPEELRFMKSSIGQKDARNYETAGQKAGFLRQIIEYKLDKSFVKKQQEILAAIDKAEIDRLIKKYIDINKMVVVVVGDKTDVLDKIEKLGLGKAIQLDSDGNPIK